MQAHAIRGMNMFDIGVIHPSNTVDLFSFSREQRRARMLHGTRIHEMCNVSNFGSLKFCLSCDPRIKNIKIYQELCHGVVSVISKDFLDDMPKTMMTMKTRFYQMASLYKILTQDMDDAERCEFFLGTRIEVTIYDINKIVDARTICIRLDLLRLEGLERQLQGPFSIHSLSIYNILANFQAQLQVMLPLIHQADHTRPSIRVQSALTCARQALGWSGKNMPTHAKTSNHWKRTQAQQEAIMANNNYQYVGCEEDLLNYVLSISNTSILMYLNY